MLDTLLFAMELTKVIYTLIGERNTQPISYEIVKTCLKDLNKVLSSVSPGQQKTLLHLIIKEITIKDKKTDQS